MKKLLIALALCLGVLAVLAFTALADNGPHGGAAFANGSTDACAGCHRLHSAKSADGFLLVATDVYALCTSCHDGTGAFTNVVDGYYTKGSWDTAAHGAVPGVTQGTEGIGLFAGGFVNARMLHAWDGSNTYTTTLPVGQTVNDAHAVGQGTFNPLGTTWGSGNVVSPTVYAGFVLTPTIVLECTSCHDPHGNAGRAGGVYTGTATTSYRLLRFSPTGSNGFEVTGPSAAYFVKAGTTQSGPNGGVYVSDVATKWYTPNTVAALDPTVRAYRTRWEGTAYSAWSLIVAGPGDYLGRSYMYGVPAANGTAGGGYWSLSGGKVSTLFTCVNGSGQLPKLPAVQITGAPVLGTNYFSCGAVPGTTTVFNNNTPRGNLGLWCSTCHDRYLATGARQTASGDANYMFRHTSTGSIPCVDCHTAHGSSSAVYATNGTNYSAAATLNKVHPSDMLKMDNRGICVRCHGTSVNFQYKNTPPTVP